MAEPLTSELKRFIAEAIPSLEHLEILLLLSSEPDRDWQVAAVYDVIKSSSAGVERALNELVDAKLVTRGQSGSFRYAPRSPQVSRQVAELGEAYKTRRIRVVEMIYSPELDELREFQRAFRFRKDQS